MPFDRSGIRRWLLTGLAPVFVLCWLAVHPPVVLAHAAADYSTPAPGAVLSRPPPRVDIWFTEHVTPGVSTIQVYTTSQQRVDRGDATVDPANALHMSVELQPLSPGVYTVVWSDISADDGHPDKGGFAFTVLLPTPVALAVAPGSPAGGVGTPAPTVTPVLTPVPASAPPAQAMADSMPDMMDGSMPDMMGGSMADSMSPASDRPTSALDLLSGWLTFSALVLVGGGAAFALWCVLPVAARAGSEGRALASRLRRRFRVVALSCAVVGATAACVSLLAKAEIATGLPLAGLVSGPVLGALLAPWSGRLWIAQEVAFGLIATVTFASLVGGCVGRTGFSSTSDRSAGRTDATTGSGERLTLIVVALLAAAGLICQALNSHLATGHVARQGPLGSVALSIHLLAVGLWVGGLGYATLLLWPVRRHLSSDVDTAITSGAIARFSPLALASVALIVLTGTYAAILLLPGPSDLLASAYGWALDVKIALLLVLVLFGAANRRTLARLATATSDRHGARRGKNDLPVSALLHTASGDTRPDERSPLWAGQGGAHLSHGLLSSYTTAGAVRSGSSPGPADVVRGAARRLLTAMRREFAVAAVVLLAAGTMLEVGPPSAAPAPSAVKLEASVPLTALPATATPVPATPTAQPTPAPPTYTSTTRAGDLVLRLAADPALAGATSELTVTITGSNGAPTGGAEVKLRLTAQSLDLGTQVLTAKTEAPGTYGIRAPAFAAPGNWQVVLTVRRDDVPEVDATFTVLVREPAPPTVFTAGTTPVPTPTVAPDTLHATLAFQPNPPAVGRDTVTVRLTDDRGRAVEVAQIHSVWLMPQEAHTTQATFRPASGAAGTYTSDVDLSRAGAWLATVTAVLSDGRSVPLQFAFNVRDQGPFGG